MANYENDANSLSLDYDQGWHGPIPVRYFARAITAVSFDADEGLFLYFGSDRLVIVDQQHSCCERRYITCDDEVQDLVGGRLVHIEAKRAESMEDDDEYGNVHDICFVEVRTDQTSITLCSHNEHNGYYGGFELTILAYP